MQTGIIFAASAYVVWGLFPLYFRALEEIAPAQILSHRIVWALGFLLIVLAARQQWAWIGKVVRQPRVLAWFAASSALLSTNWYIYIWAVTNAHVVDTSLGYFMTPLVNVLLGFLLLHERMRPAQWGAVALAAAGVAWLTVQTGHLPWIGLSLALSFGSYGLLRKTAALGALEGLTLETALLFPAALAYLIYLALHGNNAFLQAPASLQGLLAAAGPITAIPLLLFAAGARRIPMATLGLLQYIAPSIQLLLGVYLFREPFGDRLLGFGAIWIALALYSLEGLWRTWASRKNPASVS